MVKSMGMTGISKSQVSRICSELDEEVERFRNRPVAEKYPFPRLREAVAGRCCAPYVWLDATFVKAKQNHRVVSQAVVVAIGVNAEGTREVLGLDVGPSEDKAFWRGFLRGLVARGLSGVRLVTSDSNEGPKGACASILTGASWQRCRVHGCATSCPRSLQRIA